MRLIYSLLLLALCPCLPGQAQEAWSLKRCIAHAVEHNLQVRQSAQQVKQQEITLSTTRNSRLPGVDGSVSQSFNFGRGLTAENTYVNRNTMSTSFGLNANVSVYDGGQTTHNLKAQKLQLQALLADLDKAREDLSLQVTSEFLEVLFQQEQLRVARQQCELSLSQEERIRKLFDAGKASESEWADAKALVASDRLAETQAENSYRLALLSMSQLLELPSPEGFIVEAPQIPESEQVTLPLPDAIMAEAAGIKPSIKAGEYRVRSAERNILLARTGYFPKLSLGAGLGTNYYHTSGFDTAPFGQQLRDNFSRYVGVTLSVPLFDRLATHNQMRSARVQLESQKLALEQIRKDMFKEIQQAYYNAVAAQEQCSSANVAEEASKTAFALMTAKFENGQATATEYQEAKTRLLKAQAEGLKARYSFLFRCKIIDFYMGRPL